MLMCRQDNVYVPRNNVLNFLKLGNHGGHGDQRWILTGLSGRVK